MNADNKALKQFIPSKETLVLAAILIGMVVLFQIFTATFIDRANFIDILKEASKLCIISFGMAIIIAAGGIDLSLGHIAGFSAIIATTIMKEYETGIAVGLMCGLSVGLVFGLFNGALTAYLGISSFIVTLGTQFIILGLRYWITSGNIIMFLPETYTIIGNGKVFSIHNTIIIMAALAVVCYFLMERTVFGRRVSSIGFGHRNRPHGAYGGRQRGYRRWISVGCPDHRRVQCRGIQQGENVGGYTNYRYYRVPDQRSDHDGRQSLLR
jgi:ribose transport system permease protein